MSAYERATRRVVHALKLRCRSHSWTGRHLRCQRVGHHDPLPHKYGVEEWADPVPSDGHVVVGERR